MRGRGIGGVGGDADGGPCKSSFGEPTRDFGGTRAPRRAAQAVVHAVGSMALPYIMDSVVWMFVVSVAVMRKKSHCFS